MLYIVHINELAAHFVLWNIDGNFDAWERL